MSQEDTPIGERIKQLREGISTEENAQALFERYYPAVYRFFAQRGFSVEDCRDLTQDTFLGVYRGIGAFRSDARFETWLFAIAANVFWNRLRHKTAEKRSAKEVSLDRSTTDGEAPLAERLPEAGGNEGSSLDRVLRNERHEILRQAIGSLPDQMRKCLVLRVYQDLRYREIAGVMRLSVETVKAHLFQARRRLKRQLAGVAGSMSEEWERK